MHFFAELRRRNVARVGVGYSALAWLLVQLGDTLFPVFGFGGTSPRWLTILPAVGFMPVVAFAWVFEVTPAGVSRRSGL